MTNLSEKDKSLASLALFSSLYDTHRNVPDVLIDFIKMSIMEHGELILRPLQVKGYLQDDYGFDNIPMAVIEKAMCSAPYLEKSKTEKGSFIVKSTCLNQDATNYKEEVESTKNEIDQVLASLREHLKKMNFTNTDKISDANLKRALSVFFIESIHNSELSTLIHQFVLMHPEYTSILQRINDGAIIFMGLSYSTQGTEYSTLQEPLTLYLDTEILFHGAGYDGPTYEMLFKEFIDTVSRINNKYYESKGKRLIYLKFFPEIRKEVDRYFEIAEKIIAGKSQLDTSRNAMTYLVRNAKTPSDLIRTKTKFWQLLSDNSIVEEDYGQYFEKRNNAYNIESADFIKKLGVKGFAEEEEAHNNLTFLNYVNIRRRNRDQKKFSNVGYLFVSQTGQVYKLANIVQQAINPENFPLAVSLSQITARLWLGLNQGFNPSATLRSMDVIVKAQIGLSSRIKACLEKKHKELKKEYDGSTPERIADEIAALRLYVPNSPEELTSSADIVKNVNNLEQYVDDKILEVQQKDEIIRSKDKSIDAMQKQHDEDMQRKSAENEALRTALYTNVMRDHKKAVSERRIKRNRFVAKSNKRIFWKSTWPLFLVIAGSICSAILFFTDNNTSGWVSAIVTVVGIVIEFCKSLSENCEHLQNIRLPISKKLRKNNLRNQLNEFQQYSPLDSVSERMNVALHS